TYVNSSPSSVDGEKLVSCCKTVSRTEVNDPITGYWIQNYNAPCVRAVIFETEKGLFCSYHKQPWVRRKIQQFELARLSSTFLSLSTSTPTTTSLPSSPPSLTSTSTPYHYLLPLLSTLHQLLSSLSHLHPY
uniref:Chemokine interleukin-8-like domain-containing protein n=1 Tax=Oncorhynchus tshawytscha TaxID=74940 RepID=A0AAZ3PFF2_ONCTS